MFLISRIFIGLAAAILSAGLLRAQGPGSVLVVVNDNSALAHHRRLLRAPSEHPSISYLPFADERQRIHRPSRL